MKKTKVLITLNNSHISGIETFVLLVSKYINREKFDITVAVPFIGEVCNKLNELGVPYFIYCKDNRIYCLKGIICVLKQMITNKFNIIHVNAEIIPFFFAKLLNSSLIIEHRHGMDFPYDEWKKFKFVRLLWEKAKKYFADITLTGCESDRQYLINIFGYYSKNVIVLYNGIDVKISPSKENCNMKGSFIVGTIGRLTSQKSHIHFIEMAKLINEEVPDNNFRFEIWGDGEDEANLKSFITESGLSNKVFLMGYAHDREIVYRTFNLFVLSSVFEGIPFVILEAMRASLPIVSTDVGGICEVIKNNYNGLLVHKNNPLLLKEAVMKLYNDNEFSNKIRLNAYGDYFKYWGINNTINQLEELYKTYGT